MVVGFDREDLTSRDKISFNTNDLSLVALNTHFCEVEDRFDTYVAYMIVPTQILNVLKTYEVFDPVCHREFLAFGYIGCFWGADVYLNDNLESNQFVLYGGIESN